MILQSELFGFLEDGLWAVFHMVAIATATRHRSRLPFISWPFVLYMVFGHLPWVLSKVDCRWRLYTGAVYGERDLGTKVWTTLSLVLQPLIYTFMVLDAR